ncbi:hypothetical protein LPTSP4_08590 [Leptospira ryugenii]|uniref:Phosphorylase domain protein n=1 Tax=Leptospira ryugenii TaxID=1917863 RepID=A0A2P2DXI8_9LEPT|nr:phosphorylase [Leptospira ryugenii]GBF49348.1 hypothetical protein LPTSP4_08590 [Leptospira ryugenii]
MVYKDREDVLFVSAFSGEIDRLSSSLSLAEIKVLGIGNLNAALSLFVYLQSNPHTKHVFFLGSGGSYPWSDYKTGALVQSNEFYQIETAGLSGFGKQLPTEPIHFLKSQSTLPQLRSNCPSLITLQDVNHAWKEKLALCEIENLECYGIAKVCKQFGISFTAFFAITNEVGPNGSVEWQKNWRELSNQLQDKVLTFFT